LNLSTKEPLYIGIEEGNAAPIDSLLAIIGPEGTDISGIAANLKAKAKLKTIRPSRRSKAATTETVAPVAQEESTDGKNLASPLAKKIASDKGIQLNQVKGSGENGRIVKVISKISLHLPLPATS
jgi:pyruvate dehydrogenase E2 component (dihydrolipoamide acetyltransferase)